MNIKYKLVIKLLISLNQITGLHNQIRNLETIHDDRTKCLWPRRKSSK